jgi:ubiquitin thioesterase OTU1
MRPTSWGGAIELAILAQHYRAEIASVDVETGRIDKFSPATNPLHDFAPPATRCILIYSGIHYDSASLAPSIDAPPEFHQTVFSIDGGDENSDVVLRAAKLLANILRENRAFTNTATFLLRCEVSVFHGHLQAI